MKYIKFGMSTIAAQNINGCWCGKCSENNDKDKKQQQTEEKRIKELGEEITNEWEENFTLNADTIANTNVITKLDENLDTIAPSKKEKIKINETAKRIVTEYNKKLLKNNKLCLYMCTKMDYKNKSIHTSFIISEKIEIKGTFEECNKTNEEIKQDVKDGKIHETFTIKQMRPNNEEKTYIKK